ncbi:MAG: 50S ribosomal protein L32 [Deltaproteobacteria bacterium]|nr:50S ribosomal protein L32 [Deltaproteobacteria bacterium]
MAHPKRKVSKSRRDKRRTHKKASPPPHSLCAKCGESKLPHRVCQSCGTYGGEQIIAD